MQRAGDVAAEGRSNRAEALLREEFRGVRGIYLDVAARAPLPERSRRAGADMLAAQAAGAIDKDAWFALAERVRGQTAQLLNVGADEIAFTKNTSEGLNCVGAALRLGAGDEIVIASVIEHPNNIFPWLWQERRGGARRIDVASTANPHLEGAIIAAITERTKLVSVAAVDFATGRRTDLARLGRACREAGAFLLVDAAQSSGVLAEDLSSLPIDGWATATQKGLLGLYGQGLLYVRRPWIERLDPPSIARFSVELSATHEAARPESDWRLASSARRFEVGNYNFAALAVQQASLQLLLEVGAAEIEARAMAAADALRSGLEALGVPMLDVPAGHRSHIVAVGDGLGDGHDRADSAWVQDLSRAFKEAQITHSLRRGALRLSAHAYVFPELTSRVLEVAARWQHARKH